VQSYCDRVVLGGEFKLQPVPRTAIEAAPPPDVPRREVYLFVRSRWTEPSGEVRYADKYSVVWLPAAIAERAIEMNLAADPSSARALGMRDFYGAFPGSTTAPLDGGYDLMSGRRAVEAAQPDGIEGVPGSVVVIGEAFTAYTERNQI
jgi:hypothetical protein